MGCIIILLLCVQHLRKSTDLPLHYKYKAVSLRKLIGMGLGKAVSECN